MDAIQRNLELAAQRRESSSLGGTIQFSNADPMPCAVGPDVSGLVRAPGSDGFALQQTRKVVIRTCLIKDLARQPQSGDDVTVKFNLEKSPQNLRIAADNGIEQMNGILTAINLYNPNP